ncbi:intermembrane transport protein PqiB [Pelotalea chapellei]|uniref:MCE family protein n=1 Tax=Pelotalea chapellei TaxID=44671 RepID=A0ABS5U6U8_9BACT|nr:MlaD family protein [Pelotalea chapellei]MBT1071394.1 MCE family protein [Pelotalea chapellei]
MTEKQNKHNELPEAVAAPKSRFSIQLVWLVPLVAALIGGSLAINAWLDHRRAITISFKSGEGLEENQTKIKYKDVQIGEVKKIALANDRSRVLVTAHIDREAKGLLVEDTSFWVARPRITGLNVSGLGTLKEGPYIAIDVGKSDKPRKVFAGLEVPPAVSTDEPGSRFTLHAANLGSLNIGSPVLYRRIQVGQVETFELDKEGKGVLLTVFIKAPHDRHVMSESFFWQASGIDVQLSTSGVKIDTESLASILVGGIAFDSPDKKNNIRANGNTSYTLYTNRDEALRNTKEAIPFTMMFRQSVHGLSIGAAVEFKGVPVGEVTKINIDSKTNHSFAIPVEVILHPARFRPDTIGAGTTENNNHLIVLINNGLRAQLKKGNLLTGQQYIDLDFSGSGSVVTTSSDTKQFPVKDSHGKDLQDTFQRVAEKIEKLPVEELTNDVRNSVKKLEKALQSVDHLVKKLDREVTPELRDTLRSARETLGEARAVLSTGSPLQSDLQETLRQLSRAAASLGVLADYLEQHPESVIRGKSKD